MKFKEKIRKLLKEVKTLSNKEDIEPSIIQPELSFNNSNQSIPGDTKKKAQPFPPATSCLPSSTDITPRGCSVVIEEEPVKIVKMKNSKKTAGKKASLNKTSSPGVQIGFNPEGIPFTINQASPCYVCGHQDYWRSKGDIIRCRVCHPPAPGAEAGRKLILSREVKQVA